MLTSKKKSNTDWLVGRWQASEGHISVLFNISKTGKKIHIQAIDESDGEKLIVSKVKWDGKALVFETLTPSNKWRTRNRLKLTSKNKALHELTYWEPWEKISDIAFDAKMFPKRANKKQKRVGAK